MRLPTCAARCTSRRPAALPRPALGISAAAPRPAPDSGDSRRGRPDRQPDPASWFPRGPEQVRQTHERPERDDFSRSGGRARAAGRGGRHDSDDRPGHAVEGLAAFRVARRVADQVRRVLEERVAAELRLSGERRVPEARAGLARNVHVAAAARRDSPVHGTSTRRPQRRAATVLSTERPRGGRGAAATTTRPASARPNVRPRELLARDRHAGRVEAVLLDLPHDLCEGAFLVDGELG